MLSELPDEELLRRFRTGERAAFEALVRRHRAPLFTFARRMLGGSAPARAEDVVQDTFVRVIRGAAGWEERARFSTWLFSIARNLCVDAQRRERHRRTESLDAPSDDGDAVSRLHSVPADGAGPERQALNQRLRLVLAGALAGLPDDQREVFVLREYAGLPFKEIAEVTGTGENTVKSRMRYALDALRRSLQAAGIDGDLVDDDAARLRAQAVTR